MALQMQQHCRNQAAAVLDPCLPATGRDSSGVAPAMGIGSEGGRLSLVGSDIPLDAGKSAAGIGLLPNK